MKLKEYIKPKIKYVPADELDAIEATMSGGSGGGYTPVDSSRPFNYKSTAAVVAIDWSWKTVRTVNSYWFVIKDSGVHSVEISLAASVDLTIFSEGGTAKVTIYDGTVSAGTRTFLVETTYSNSTYICITPSVLTTIKVRAKRYERNIASSSIGAGGVEWVPSNPLYRPDESPVCLFRWYISQSVVGAIIEAFEKDAPTIRDLVLGRETSRLAELLAKYLNKAVATALPYAEVVVDLVETLSDLSQWVVANGLKNSACDSSGAIRNGVLFILEYNVSGDGTTVQTPSYSFQKWHGGSASGAVGYDTGKIKTLS